MIPQGWQEKTLGEVCEIISGTTPDTSNNEFWGKGNYWITPAEINEDSLYINGTARTITNRAVECCSLRKMPRGTVLFSSRAPIGKIAISNVDVLYCNQGFKNFMCSKNINNKFLYYFLFKNKKYLISLGKGTTFKEVSKSIISVVNIQYPPLPEQERIVAKLDKAFEAIDKVKSNAEQNLNNAKELFESALNKALLKSETANIKTTFGKEFKIKSGDFLSAQHMDVGGKYNVYGGNGVNGNYNHYNCSGENIIIGRVGEKCGNVHYVNEDVWVTDNAFILTQTEHPLDKKFLYYLLTKLNLRKYAAKSTHPVISGKSMKDVLVCFPDNINTQQKIVEKLDALQEQTKRLEQIYTQKIKECDELKQSILQKAFRGEL